DLHKTAPSLLAADYTKWKAVDPTKPVFINFSGGELLNHTTSNTTYQQYMASAEIIGNDFYPVTGWGRPDWIDYSKTVADRKTEGMAIKGYSDLSGGKPQWAFIETSAQKLSWIPNGRGVTPAEFRGEVWDAIINGAKGIAYFPQQIGSGFRFDMTPADVVSEMTTQNGRIQSLARVLNASANPTADKIAMNSTLLEGARKNYDGDQYFFILNMSSKTLSSQAVSLPGLGALTRVDVFGEGRELNFANGQLMDQFDPWEMHVYHADLAGFGILPAASGEIAGAGGAPVPEPSCIAVMGLAVVGLSARRRA
ncbi:MAG TPA: PEP-CTERM sorting domain-containing protein, partial [Tepidisphaeraceae bacterium]|nr:PEP-CTERM sorting domain-containing protein [Tepidisphaeraceae bacterium]